MSAVRSFGRRILVVGLVGLLLGSAVAAQAQEPLDEQVRQVAAQLRCPVCQNLSVADSPSEMAQQMRGVIREQLQAGKTPEEVRAYFLDKYGDWILLSPRPRGLGLLVWIGPFAAAAVGLVVAGLAVRRWSRRRRRAPPAAADLARLERVCREALAEVDLAGPADGTPRSPLEAERAGLYAALRELDFDHRAGKLSAEDYAEMRQEYGARAAAVVAALEAAAPAAALESPGPPAAPVVRPRRAWRLAASGVFLLAFGVALGSFLDSSLRPRMGDQGSITGDFLTGTGPGGISPDSAEQMARMEAGPRGGPAAGGMPGPVVALVREYGARLDRDPRDLEALLGMARLNLQRQDVKAAIDYYKRALEIDPGNPEALAHFGLILVQAGEPDVALTAFDRALTRNPNDPRALWGKGSTLYEAKQDYAGAIEAWERLLATNPDLAPADADQVARLLVEARKKLAAGGAPEPRTSPQSAEGR